MTDIAEIAVKVTGADDAVEVMERLATAAERVADALDRLNGQPHGGISLVACGSMMKMDVAPPK